MKSNYFLNKSLAKWQQILNQIKTHRKNIPFYICHFSGARAIWWKINPPADSSKRKPASFLLWLTGIYFAFYGVALQTHENRISKIELRLNTVINHISNKETRNYAFSQIPSLQHTKAPIRPELFKPTSVFISLFGQEEIDEGILGKTKLLAYLWKHELNNLYLYGIDLSGMQNLDNANFSNSNLTDANFTGSTLTNSNFSKSNLTGTNFTNSNLTNSNLDESCLNMTNFSYAVLLDAKARNIDSNKCEFIIADNNRHVLYNLTSNIKDSEEQHDSYDRITSGNTTRKFIKHGTKIGFDESFYYYDIRNPDIINIDEQFSFGKIPFPLTTNFSYSKLIRTDFKNTDTTHFILWGSELATTKISQDQLLRVKTLYEAHLSKDNLTALSEIRPELLDIPTKDYLIVYCHKD